MFINRWLINLAFPISFVEDLEFVYLAMFLYIYYIIWLVCSFIVFGYCCLARLRVRVSGNHLTAEMPLSLRRVFFFLTSHAVTLQTRSEKLPSANINA